jgi:phosphoglycerol transferase MdoB-like AlkP superfamily enzyme
VNIAYYVQRLKPSFIFFISIQILIRTMFVVWEWNSLEMVNILKAYAMGAVFDVTTYMLVIMPYILYLLILPIKKHHSRLDKIITHGLFIVLVGAIIFDIASEYAFWEEFKVRFNFIAVDYLVYADEVIGNILESYPMTPIILGITAVVGAIYFGARKQLIPNTTPPRSFRSKALTLGGFVLIAIMSNHMLKLQHKDVSHNIYANEIAANGIYSLFSAFNSNELDYANFYLTSKELGIKAHNERPVTSLIAAGPAKKKNVIFIMMESMGAEYMARYGNTEGLTPNLDALAKQSLNFTRLYATGTRTVRGLEALTLSIPPAPGRSIVKRPNNENLYSLGYVFKDRGYDTKFIYGGYGYFDNMNYFYANNGFNTVDRSDMSDDEIHFANIWGVGDEDLFAKVIKEARKAHEKNTPFMQMVMTTSNHRPYTFPENSAGIPQEGGGRRAGVKYADYAIGKLIEAAKKEPWFNDTVFVIVADHTAGASGKTSLPPARYHIPAMIYAPAMIKPQENHKLSSQIDLPVTLLALLGVDYQSKFFGKNILDDAFEERALLATHQKLGVYKDGMVTFIEPVKLYGAETEQGKVIDDVELSLTSPQLHEVVRNYEGASQWKEKYQKLPTTLIENSR